MKIKRIALASAMCLSVLAAAGCKSKEATDITFLLDWAPNTNHTGLFVAQELGYYKEAGLNVKIEQPGETGTSLLVHSGKAQFGIDFQDQMVPNHANNMKTTAIAAVIQHNTSGIISLKKSNITSPKDMEGKVYATWGLPIEQKIIAQCMKNDNDGDFSKVEQFPDFVTDALTSMQAGNIDCAWIFEGWDLQRAKQENLDYNYFSFRDYDSRLDFYTPVIIGNNDFIENNPEVTKKFLEATKKGYTYAIEHSDEAAEILHKITPETPIELIKLSQSFLANEYISDAKSWGVIDATRWNNFFGWVNDNGLVENKIPADYGFTNKYL